jgi:hypothetical protein
MKKSTIETRVGSFVDYAGNERKYVIAAVSEVLPIGIEYKVTKLTAWDYSPEDVVKKRLSIGFSVCAPQDDFNEALGKEIAIGKALKRPVHVFYVNNIGLINTPVVEAILKHEMEFFEKHPETVVIGYNNARVKYETKLLAKLAKEKAAAEYKIVKKL